MENKEIKYLKVEGHNHLVRDPKTNAIINTNSQGHKEYVSLRNAKNNEIARINNIQSELNGLRDELGEIKFLLRRLVNDES